MRLRHAAQRYIAKQGTYMSNLRPHTVGSGHDLTRKLGVYFQLEMVKIVLTSHFHKKVRAIIGLVPTSQLP